MAESATIRPASEADAAAIAALTRALTAAHISADFPEDGKRFLHDALGPERVIAELRGPYRYFVAEAAGALVGVVATRDDRHLLKLFVAEAAQGQGMARALWECAHAACVAAGHAGPFTVSAALGAVQLYEKLGFVASGPATTEHGVTRVPMATPA